MSRTAEVVTKVQAVMAAITYAKTTDAEALERAVELTEQAIDHGWNGVATCMQGAHDALEAVIASLVAAEDATGEALAMLGAITDQMSNSEVASQLGQAVKHLDRSRTDVDAASSGLDNARTAAEQAGSPEMLMSMLQTISAEIGTAWRGLDVAKSSIAAEQQAAGSWGNSPRAMVYRSRGHHRPPNYQIAHPRKEGRNRNGSATQFAVCLIGPQIAAPPTGWRSTGKGNRYRNSHTPAVGMSPRPTTFDLYPD